MNIKIQFDGDSTSDSVDYPGNYTEYAGAYLESLFPEHEFTIINIAVSGQPQSAMLSDITGHLNTNNPHIACCFSSLNDLPTADPILISNWRDYANIVTHHRNPDNSRTYFIGGPDNFCFVNEGESYERPVAAQEQKYNACLDALTSIISQWVTLVDWFQDFRALGIGTTELGATLRSDGVHPNDSTGRLIMQDRLFPELVRIVEIIIASQSSGVAMLRRR